eukprot:TRINITY_DN3032_c0_g1_i16.p1 TRINITY_DN3032_c0_g1~~TRINITY_DN3032_c0_g1_i16.p1  ORF type:complete len:268 (-),score=43.75 TRINITY_DN3032_c0_g1_i16:118-921(-)
MTSTDYEQFLLESKRESVKEAIKFLQSSMMCDGYLLIDSAFLLKKEADIVALEERLNSCKNELSSEIQTIKSSLKAENIEKALKALQLGQTSRKKKHQDLTALHRIKDRLSLAKELSLFERDALESYKDKLNQVYTNLSVAQEDVNNLMQTMDFAKDSINPPASIRREEESLTLIQKMHDLPTEHRLLRNKIFDLPMTEAENGEEKIIALLGSKHRNQLELQELCSTQAKSQEGLDNKLIAIEERHGEISTATNLIVQKLPKQFPLF